MDVLCLVTLVTLISLPPTLARYDQQVVLLPRCISAQYSSSNEEPLAAVQCLLIKTHNNKDLQANRMQSTILTTCNKDRGAVI
eukprot:scaffold34338_cov212-Skeletonema_marinoi.AAC.3